MVLDLIGEVEEMVEDQRDPGHGLSLKLPPNKRHQGINKKMPSIRLLPEHTAHIIRKLDHKERRLSIQHRHHRFNHHAIQPLRELILIMRGHCHQVREREDPLELLIPNGEVWVVLQVHVGGEADREFSLVDDGEGGHQAQALGEGCSRGVEYALAGHGEVLAAVGAAEEGPGFLLDLGEDGEE